MSKQQKNVLIVLALAGCLYFAAFFAPNTYAIDAPNLTSTIGDEVVTYPNVVRMLTPGKTLVETRGRIFLYEDYHYGYPFYAYSALVLLPVKLMYGEAFPQQAPLNLLLLRQFVSTLPIILAAGVLVFVQTRFHSLWKSLALFVFLLTIRGVVRQNIQWWHPDALTVLCVVLTIFFLARDRLRFGRNFYLAAVACGLATAIKLAGVFFFLTIPVYVLVGWLQKQVSLKKAVMVSALFVVIMSATMVLANPFLVSKIHRDKMIEIQTFKRVELDKGYAHDDPLYYSKGPQWWEATLSMWYGVPLVLGFLLVSVVVGCFYGPSRLANLIILTWVVPYSIYLLYFVAPKPDHYWLPIMLPLFSGAFTLVDVLAEKLKADRGVLWQKIALGVVVLVLVGQFVFHIGYGNAGDIPWYFAAMQ